MMFSCSIIPREEHIKSRHESKNQKVFKSDFKEVLYSTAKIIIEVFHTRDQNHVTAGGDSILGVKLCNSCNGSSIDMLSKLAANLVKASLGLM